MTKIKFIKGTTQELIEWGAEEGEMTKQFQTIRLEVVADRIENKPTNHKFTMSGCTLDEAVEIISGLLKKLEIELEIQREKLCVIEP